jgi:hypothetical protein
MYISYKPYIRAGFEPVNPGSFDPLTAEMALKKTNKIHFFADHHLHTQQRLAEQQLCWKP